MRAAFYETNITPPLGDFIWGYYDKHYGVDVEDVLIKKSIELAEKIK